VTAQPSKRIYLTNCDGEVLGALIGHALSHGNTGGATVSDGLMAIAEAVNNLADAVRENGVTPTVTTTIPAPALKVPIVPARGVRR
jgi:hypothetical protein